MAKFLCLLLGMVWFSAVAQDGEKKTPPPPGISVIVEYIEVGQQTFSDYLSSHPLTEDATDLRKQVRGWAKDDRAKLIETMIVRTRSGERAKVESVSEVFYPTEYTFPEVPLVEVEKDEAGNDMPVDMSLPILPIIPPLPTAFDLEKVGTSLEVDPTLSKDQATIDLSIAPRLVTLLPRREWESKMGDKKQVVETPTFHSANIVTRITIKNGSYGFLGTSRLPESQRSKLLQDSLVLIFVRGDAF